MHDLLTDPLIGVCTTEGECFLNLPKLLAALSAGRIEGYLGLRPHQADPWHVFLVQLAASIQARHPTDRLPDDAVYWREGLLDLAEGQDTAWSLVVEDVTKPAFLQHPWASQEEKTNFKPKAYTPDELDVLVTSKNHDVKMARVGSEAVQAWVFALLMLQTTSGYLGGGNYGIVRMNAGLGSRCIVVWAQSLNPSRRFIDEVGVLQTVRKKICEEFLYQQRGTVLTWLKRWNRDCHQHLLKNLEPWFIEAARPVRLFADPDGALFALCAISKARQIGPETLDNGDVGDPWTPINVSDKKKGRSALTLFAEGWTPQRVTDLLFEQGFELTALQNPKPGNESGWFVAGCLVRGKGTTGGFHRIELPVPPKIGMSLLSQERRKTLAQLAQVLLRDARDVGNTLGKALAVFTEGGLEPPDLDRDAVKRWVERSRTDFNRYWESTYFPSLWRGADEDHDTVRKAWQQQLVNRAQAVFDEAAMRLPLPSNRYWRAVTQANGAWRGVLHKLGFPMPAARASEPAESIEESIA